MHADEGMWMLGNLNKETRKTMKELGLQMPADQLYSTRHPSLKDAVVSFGGFCSGVVVSEDGLVFTNHHCGFSSIQQHSSVDHDYLKDGFTAHSREEELPNPELYVRFLLRTENVTRRVLKATTPGMTESERSLAIDSMMVLLGDEVTKRTLHWSALWMRITVAMSFGFLFTAISTMYAWCLLHRLPSVSLVGIRTIGCGPVILAISASFVSMPVKTTVLPTIHPTTCPIVPNTWLPSH